MVKTNHFIILHYFLLIGKYSDIVYPSILKAEITSRVNFLCDSNHIISWSHNGRHLPDNAKVMGARNDILIIYDVTLRNAGRYYCKYQDKEMKNQKSSTYLIVYSNDTFKCLVNQELFPYY